RQEEILQTSQALARREAEDLELRHVQMELDSAGLTTREGLVQELEDARVASVAAIRSGVDRIRELQQQAEDDREKARRDKANCAFRWSEIRRREGDLYLKERD